ncbi:MAG: hypothetical protein P8H62_01110 [Henriciella sp.]|nr:hypothetical protein [Henriciella sp.]
MFKHALTACLFSGLALSLGASAQDSYGIERGTGKVICTNDLDDNRAADDPSYAISAMWDQMVLGQTECSGKLTPLDGGTWGASEPVEGLDAAGLAATFKLYVLHDRYTWKLGSSKQIQDAGTPVPFSDVLNTPQFFERFCASKAVLALGAASHDGPTALNHRLAGNRGQIVGRSLASSRRGCSEGQVPIVYAINLGEHQNLDGSGSGDSSPQRRLIIVAAEKMTIGVNLKEALKTALANQAVLDVFSASDYDLFEFNTL